MEGRIKKAIELFNEGYNCSQAVFVAFADKYGIDSETALKLSISFGGGFAGMRNTCGAVSAMAMVAGLERGTTIAGDKEGKARNYAYVNSLVEKFKEEHGSILCKHLIGLEQADIPVKRKDCCEYVGYCAQLLGNDK